MSEVGEVFLGLAVMALALGVIAWFFWLFRNSHRIETAEADIRVKMYLLEEEAVSMVARKENIDLTKLLMTKEYSKGREFQKRLQQEMIKDFFGEEKK